MAALPRTRLSTARADALRTALDALIAQTDGAARLAGDPLGFVHRYTDPGDQEVAAVLASGLAYGRVAAFSPVIEAVLARADARGGPRAWVLAFDDDDAAALAPLVYRWMRGPDIALFAATLGSVLHAHGRLGAVAESAAAAAGADADAADLAAVLDHLVGTLRAHAEAIAGAPFGSLPRGFRYFLPRPSDGSACKRWCMLLRWLVRRPGPTGRVDGLDLGLWDLSPGGLVIPLDTHVHRLSLLLGLTRRPDASWRTAAEITANLRRLDPDDPIRFDFALAHLGISGRCTVRRTSDRPPALAVCQRCSLVRLCRVGRRRVR